MKKFAVWITACAFLLMASGCTYKEAYVKYAEAQATMAQAAGPLVTLHPNGTLASLGNPMVPMAMMQMKPPKSEAEAFFDWLKMATPFAAMWGLAGTITSGSHGTTTNVSGTGNYTGNAMGNQGLMGSPTTTTVTEFAPPVVE